ncbi:MAG: ABC transporter substrate-binding protein [Acidobacteriota bacterium]
MSEILRVGITTPITLTDPRKAFDFVNSLVYWHLYQKPFRPTAAADGATEAVLFKGPLEPTSADGTAYSGQVRPGLCFSNGAPLDASRLAESLRQSRVVQDEAKIRVDGDRLHFALKRPHRDFDCLLSHQTCAVVHEDGGRLFGSGPYLVSSFEHGAVRLRRNERYHPLPPIPEVEFLIYPPAADGRPRELMAALERGEVDFSPSLARDDLREVRGVHKWMGQGDSTAYLYFNTEHPLLRRRELRQALALALDRRALAAASYASPLAFAASGPVPPSVAVMPDGLRCDPDAARRALDDVGRPSKPLRMLVVSMARPYLPHPQTTAELLARQLAHVGVEVEVSPSQDLAGYLRRVSSGDYDLALSGWIPESSDTASLFEAIFSSRAIPDTPESVLTDANVARWRHAPMDEALDRYRRNPQADALDAINSIISAERPLVPLLYGSQVVVHSWRMKARPKSYFNRPFFTAMRL